MPRIQQFSRQLNDEANFVEIPWGFIDDDGDKVTYIFRRNNELLVSKKGEVATGRWEYLPVVQSMLIEYNGAKRMYNQGFLDKAVMVLRKDGTEEVFALANSQIIHDLRIDWYLKEAVEKGLLESPKDRNQRPQIYKTLANGQEIIFWFEPGEISIFIKKGIKVTLRDSMTFLPDGAYILKNGSKLLVHGGLVENYKEKNFGLIYAVGILIFFLAAMLFMLLIYLVAPS